MAVAEVSRAVVYTLNRDRAGGVDSYDSGIGEHSNGFDNALATYTKLRSNVVDSMAFGLRSKIGNTPSDTRLLIG